MAADAGLLEGCCQAMGSPLHRIFVGLLLHDGDDYYLHSSEVVSAACSNCLCGTGSCRQGCSGKCRIEMC